MSLKKVLSLVLVFLLVSTFTLQAKSKKSGEKRFQIGFGLSVSTNNIVGMVENVKMLQAINNGGSYSNPALTDEQNAAFSYLDKNMQKGLVIANILGQMEYGVQMRILWHMVMFETDLVLLPYDTTSNGKLDFYWVTNIGIRAPFWIMPYITGGVNFTFSIYPEEVAKINSWKSDWGSVGKFVFRPGFNIKTGLDLKFKRFSVGVYYQYMVKDVTEFQEWAALFGEQGEGFLIAKVLGSQSRFGLAMCWYLL